MEKLYHVLEIYTKTISDYIIIRYPNNGIIREKKDSILIIDTIGVVVTVVAEVSFMIYLSLDK